MQYAKSALLTKKFYKKNHKICSCIFILLLIKQGWRMTDRKKYFIRRCCACLFNLDVSRIFWKCKNLVDRIWYVLFTAMDVHFSDLCKRDVISLDHTYAYKLHYYSTPLFSLHSLTFLMWWIFPHWHQTISSLMIQNHTKNIEKRDEWTCNTKSNANCLVSIYFQIV